jgi:outer membrane protein TolC
MLLSLKAVVLLAKNQSPSYYYAVNLKENKYWQWRTFKSNYRPQLSVSGTLPNFTRSYTPVVQPQGDLVFQSVSNASSDVRLDLSQSIGLTGATIYVSSLVRRFDNFQNKHSIQYSGNPAIIGIKQPLFGFNQLLWDKKIEPLKYEESNKEYVEELERISVQATDYFFDLLLAQISLQVAEQNRESNDTIYKIALRRYDLGKIFENELLQLELTLLNSQQSVSKARLDLEVNMLAIKVFTGIIDDRPIELIIPDSIPYFEVFEDVALSEARKNRAAIIGFKRQSMEAQKEIAVARSNNGLKAYLGATYGNTGKASTVSALYRNPMDQQSLDITFQVPILDWGRSKSRMETAESNKKLVQNTLEQGRLNFDKEVYTHVKLFKMMKEQLKITKKADDISVRRYQLSKSRFIIGKLGITDLNIALQEKDNAKRSYITLLRDYWKSYFELRRLTLYNFETDVVIEE